MSLKVPKSLIAKVGIDDLAKAVADHKAEHSAWSAHMARVEADAKLPPIPRPAFADYAKDKDPAAALRKALEVYEANVATRHQPYPAPIPHPLVDRALDGFVVIDDDPTPDQVLADKKLALIHKVAEAEAQAIAAVLPPLGKQRAFNMREQDIANADAAVVAALSDAVRTDPAKVAKAVERARSKDDTDFLKAQADRRARSEAIARAAARMMSDVEDLTADTIDNWRMASFNATKNS
jgi:hypothetical protein